MDGSLSIVIKPALRALFESGWEQYRILLFSAPCGFGKTAVATALLAEHAVCTYSAAERDILSVPIDPDCEAVLIDELQLMQDSADQSTLCERMKTNPDKRFVLLSRGIVPGWLMPFQFTGLMLTIDANALLFDRATTARLLAQNGIAYSDTELTAIQRDTNGYPLAVSILCRHMAGQVSYSEAVADEVRRRRGASGAVPALRASRLPPF